MNNELDLHGFPVAEALRAFVTWYNDRVDHGDFRGIVVIHGYGSSGEGGTIRARLRAFLARSREYLEYAPGEDLGDGNLGNTIVFPHKRLPSALDALAVEIVAYCDTPKTITKIAGKFRSYGENAVLQALRNLEKQKVLTVRYKGSNKLYVTAATPSSRPNPGLPEPI